MTSLHVQSADHAVRYADSDGSLVSIGGQALLGGSSNAPKFGTLIPNRIFVGGIPSNTTEQELKSFFSSFGQVKDVKIINDRLGVAKGSYGFVTFENQDMAEKIIKNESETLIFKDRKLNIGHAIRKQQVFPRPADVPATLFLAGGAIPCGFSNGMTVFPLAGQDYSVLAQPGSPYQSMMLQQSNGAVYLSPQQSTQAAVQYSALQSQLGSSNPFLALQQQQQYQQAALNSTLAAGSLGLASPASNSTAAMMAAAAAIAASGQWSNSVGNSSSPTSQQLSNSSTQFVSNGQNGNQSSSGYCNLDSQPQIAAFAAAAVAAQQQMAAAWGWPTTQQNGVSSQSTNGVLTSSPVISSCTTTQTPTNSTSTTTGISPIVQQQVSNPIIEGLQQLSRAQHAHVSQQQLLATAAILSSSQNQQLLSQIYPHAFFSGIDCSTLAALAAMAAGSMNTELDNPLVGVKWEEPNSPFRSAKRPRLNDDGTEYSTTNQTS